MEHIRAQHGPMSFAGNTNGAPDYDNVDDVQTDVKSLMSRMKTLTDFIHNQNELASSLGVEENANELQEEQLQLQKKLAELKNRKQQMSNLVNELQSLNIQADTSFQTRRSQTPTRNVPIEYERIVPIELLQNTARINGQMPILAQSSHHQQQHRFVTPLAKSSNDVQNGPSAVSTILQPESMSQTGDDEALEHDDVEGAAAANAAYVNEAGLNDKIAELNAMKNQLKRLQEMMETVKMIEIKADDCPPAEIGYDTKPSNTNGTEAHNVTDNTASSVNNENPPRDDEEQQMADRVHALHSMTNDLRQQAFLLAGERDRLKDIKNEMTRRRDYSDSSEKNVKQKQHSQPPQQQQQQQQSQQSQHMHNQSHLYDEKFDANEARRFVKKSTVEPVDRLFYEPENWQQNLNGSAASSLQSGRYGDGRPLVSLSNKPPSGAQGKDSNDSGAPDVLNMSVEAASLHSGSSRGFSVPPPMRNIDNREAGKFVNFELFGH